MPPTFPYLIALIAYLAVAGAVWIVAFLLALDKSTRWLAKRLAAGMAGSFPGVFLFQLLCVPVLALAFLLLNGVAFVMGPSLKPPGAILVVLALFIISIPVVASLLGFYVGWRVAWEWTAGRSLRAFAASDWLLGPIIRRFL